MCTNLNELPIKYREATTILQHIDSKKKSLKNCMANLDPSISEKDKKAIYALSITALKNRETINKMKEFCLKLNQELNGYLLEILIGKLIFEKKVAIYSLPHGISETDIIVENKRKLASFKGTRQKDSQTHVYLRINLLKSNLSEIIPVLEANGFTQDLTESESFENFISNCHRLKMRNFIKDYHFPEELLIFRPKGIKYLTNLDIYKEGKVIIQDKASLLVVKSMGLKKRMTILDVCCAPGTKTAAMAATIKNKGTIISIDRDEFRLKEMEQLIGKLGVTCCSIVRGDFIELADNYKSTDIDVLLLDPSCSGSGRPDMSAHIMDKSRIGKLAGFQTFMLKTALSLRPKKLIYSTCSKDVFENENVVQTALNESPDSQHYQIVNPVPDWPMFGKSKYPFADKVIRSDETLLTRGFFFCVLERIDL